MSKESSPTQSANALASVDVSSVKRSKMDTGSSEVQLAQLTHRVHQLTKHFKEHKKDFHSRMGLVKMINKRKRLLSYLKKNQSERYQAIVQKLGLRK